MEESLETMYEMLSVGYQQECRNHDETRLKLNLCRNTLERLERETKNTPMLTDGAIVAIRLTLEKSKL